MAKLDDFRGAIAWPKREANIASSLKLEERMADKPGKHGKWFASECMQVILSLCLYVELQPQLQDALHEEIRSLLLLGRILYILRTGHRAVEKLVLLSQLVLQHHLLFARLYPDCVKKSWDNYSCRYKRYRAIRRFLRAAFLEFLIVLKFLHFVLLLLEEDLLGCTF